MRIYIETVKKKTPKLTSLTHLCMWTEICIPNMDSASQLYPQHFLYHSRIASKSDFVIGINVDPL